MFKAYPKIMFHPQHTAAVYKQMPRGNGVGFMAESDTVMTSPERFPQVTVNNEAQEQQYAAKGYRPANMGNAQEYEQVMLESGPVAGYLDAKFPKWKYHPYQLAKTVKDAGEEAALGDGWQDSPVVATEDDLPMDEYTQGDGKVPKLRGRKPNPPVAA